MLTRTRLHETSGILLRHVRTWRRKSAEVRKRTAWVALAPPG